MNEIRYTYNRLATERFPLPSEKQVQHLEKKLGIEFPPDYREFLLEFNGEYFESPVFQPVGDDCCEDALLFLCGIGASHAEAELACGRHLAVFDDNDPLLILPIGDTDTGGLIILTTEQEGRGEILLKEAFGGFHYLASGIEEFFTLLRENEDPVK